MTMHTPSRAFAANTASPPVWTRPIPAAAGIGLRLPHHAEMRENPPAIAWLEAHPENHLTPAAADELAAAGVR